MRILIILFILCTMLVARDGRGYIDERENLKGYWKFEIGDNPKWAEPDFNDESWEEIYVPSTWEDEGFPGYDGFAWYRKTFYLNKNEASEHYYLYMGVIDDVDETYVNGHFAGYRGQNPPDYKSDHGSQRKYYIPASYLNFGGENVIAVRVYDDHQEGGIKRGRVALVEEIPDLEVELSLAGIWDFNIGDDPDWKQKKVNVNDWDKIIVPAIWQTQGYKNVHGVAWYRKTFTVDKDLEDERLILLLGKIDDLDETYLNGRMLGKTGRIAKIPEQSRLEGYEYATLRAYYIPADYLNFKGKNTVAVRVYDGPGHGGIYEGPIGIVDRSTYLRWKKIKKRQRNRDIWDFLFGH